MDDVDTVGLDERESVERVDDSRNQGRASVTRGLQNEKSHEDRRQEQAEKDSRVVGEDGITGEPLDRSNQDRFGNEVIGESQTPRPGVETVGIEQVKRVCEKLVCIPSEDVGEVNRVSYVRNGVPWRENHGPHPYTGERPEEHRGKGRSAETVSGRSARRVRLLRSL
jgi:hypothetical protein